MKFQETHLKLHRCPKTHQKRNSFFFKASMHFTDKMRRYSSLKALKTDVLNKHFTMRKTFSAKGETVLVILHNRNLPMLLYLCSSYWIDVVSFDFFF